MHALTVGRRRGLASTDHSPTHDVNAVVAYNIRAIRKLRGLTQEDVAERLAVFTGHRLPQASISAMERSFDNDRRRLFDAHTLYLLSKVFDVAVIYFFLPPPPCLDHILAGTNEPTSALIESALGPPEALPLIDRRLVEITGGADGDRPPESTSLHLGSVERWRHDLRRLADVDCNARLREIADLLRAVTERHGPVGAETSPEARPPVGPDLPFLHWMAVAGRSRSLGPDARPVAVPDDVDDPRHTKATGRVQLPITVDWSGGEPLMYDLDRAVDRRRVYEQVLREGGDDDVRRYIDVDVLLGEWDQLVLPPRVRRAWAEWFRHHRGVDLAC